MPDVNVRRATLADIPAIIALDRQTPNAAHWSSLQYEARIGAEKLPMSESLALIAEETLDSGTENATPAIFGFLVAHRVDKEWELENIVVAENLRWRGIGSNLAKEFLKYAGNEMEQGVSLEVRESNKPARAFYRKLGCKEMGRRKGYYSNPQEDCIICGMRL
ncbi:MAG TPA: GNAT family N-acetyltransferase [Candidatus Sulfotelmatobacter sp.]|jgi:ribosomal protein S18 acetylase RimI-like enzyme